MLLSTPDLVLLPSAFPALNKYAVVRKCGTEAFKDADNMKQWTILLYLDEAIEQI